MLSILAAGNRNADAAVGDKFIHRFHRFPQIPFGRMNLCNLWALLRVLAGGYPGFQIFRFLKFA